MKHIHILGICGTFMGSLAVLAKQSGYRVSGSDANVYPPMSTQLEAHGIELMESYDPSHFTPEPDMVIVGNALSRGNPMVEAMLSRGLDYMSGPEWLARHVLHKRWVAAVSGTHGKTTTSSMLAWILQSVGMKPGFLIGGVAKNFNTSAQLGDSAFFVIEADEYDTAFFDKRSKFVHYRPRTVIINNLEYDHADIFENLAAIQKQFHHMIRTVPENGLLIHPDQHKNITDTLAMGCWTPTEALMVHEHTDSIEQRRAQWQAELLSADGSSYGLYHQLKPQGTVHWQLNGHHNVENALAAIAAAHHLGVPVKHALGAMESFSGVKRRLEHIGEQRGVHVYDDFAHHPTAIATTLEGMRHKHPSRGLIAVIEPRSNTMRLGLHREQLLDACKAADRVLWFEPSGLSWDMETFVKSSPVSASCYNSIEQIIEALVNDSKVGDHIVIMSNGSFSGIHQRLLTALKESADNGTSKTLKS